MTVIEVAERKGRYREANFYFFGAMSLTTLWWSMARSDSDFLRGSWVGLTFAAAATLVPLARGPKPSSEIARLLDDYGVREHRRISCTAGFWMAICHCTSLCLLCHTQVWISFTGSSVFFDCMSGKMVARVPCPAS